MARILKRLMKNQRGQALAEYHVLIPGVILLAIVAAWGLGPGIGDVYRHLTAVMLGPMECVPEYNFEDNSICDQNDLCAKAEYDDEDTGSFIYEDALTVDSVVIKAGKTYEIVRDDPFQFTYSTDDGCYEVTFKTNRIDWQRTGNGPDCQSVSHADYWQAPICVPES